MSLAGVILAGGNGTRLAPITEVSNKHLVPLLNTPMILYPLETLKSFGITKALIVSGRNHIGGFADFLGDGSRFGMDLTYRVQKDAAGIAQALSLTRDYCMNSGSNRVMVILGDNVFDTKAFETLRDSLLSGDPHRAHIIVKETPHAQRFGVLCDEGGRYHIEEKPTVPKSNKVITGLYIYPMDVFDRIEKLTPSGRGEYEITDINNQYLSEGKCDVSEFPGFWSDAGTPESLFEATEWVYRNRSAA